MVFIKGQKVKISSELGSLNYKRRCINEHQPTLNVFFNFSDLSELANQCLRELHSQGKTAFHSVRQRKEHKEKGGNKIVQETIRVRCSIDSYVTRRRVNWAPQQIHRNSDHGTWANSGLHLGSLHGQASCKSAKRFNSPAILWQANRENTHPWCVENVLWLLFFNLMHPIEV